MADAEERNQRQELRDRSFELQKHVSTLSTAASLLLLAVYRERPFEVDLLAITLLLLAISAVLAVYGMTVIALDQHRPIRFRLSPESFDRHVYVVASISSNLLTAGVIAFALFLFDVPPLWALGVVGVAAVVLLLIRRKKQRPWWKFW